jgi:hypothetical protein
LGRAFRKGEKGKKQRNGKERKGGKREGGRGEEEEIQMNMGNFHPISCLSACMLHRRGKKKL